MPPQPFGLPGARPRLGRNFAPSREEAVSERDRGAVAPGGWPADAARAIERGTGMPEAAMRTETS